MAAVEDRLNRLDQRLETLIASMNGLLDIQIEVRAMLAELMAWLQKPPSNELPKLMMRLAEAVEANNERQAELRQEVAGLPAKLAQAVRG
jgi:septal ring factor EnvC (AmiA/AmiB activator)